VREKLNYPSLKRRVIEQARGFNADSIVIEDKGSGISLIQDLRGGNENIPYPISFTPEIDKVTRMSAQSAKIEAGHVFLPRRAEWLDDFRAELLQFPYGRYDDQVDSVSQFLNWIDRRQRNRMWIFPLEL
jgi:predicted phage terminase large subunit-like protein